MEPLSAASSVFAVVSLALQLGSTIQNLIEFWDSVKEAPAKVADIKAQLRILSALHSSLKNDVRASAHDESLDEVDIGLEGLRLLAESMAKVELVVRELDAGLNGSKMRRQWTCLTKHMRDKKLKRYWNEIEMVKSTLIWYQLSRNRPEQDSMLAAMLEIIRTLPVVRYTELSKRDIKLQTSSRNSGFTKISLGCSNYELVLSFGTIRIRFSSHLLQRKGQQILISDMMKRRQHRRLNVSFIPGYLLPSALHWSFHQDFGSWKNTFQSFNIRPEGSRIFRACKHGDISVVQMLIDEGVASPHDVDQGGLTPLHHAAVMHRPEMCRMLINLGAKPNAVTARLQTPLMIAADGTEFNSRTDPKNHPLDSESQLDTIRVLVEHGLNDPMDVDDVGYNALLRAAGTIGNRSLSWLLNQDTYEIDLRYKAPNGHMAHAYASIEEDMTPSLLDHFLGSGLDINAPCANWWYSSCAQWWYSRGKARYLLSGPSMLHYSLWSWYDRLVGENDPTFTRGSSWPDRASGSPLNTIKLLLSKGADIHAQSTSGHTVLQGILLNFVQFDGYARPPEILAVTINAYLDLIQSAGISLPEYIRHEEEMHASISYDLGLGLHMKLCFDENKSSCVSAAFQGLEERERGKFVDHITKCAIWETWRKTYTAPELPSRNIEAKYLTSAELIVIRPGPCDLSEEVPSNQLQKNEPIAFTFEHLSYQLTNFLRNAKQQIISSSKYRFEFSVYVLFLSSLFGWGYSARFMMTAMMYASLRFVERLAY